MNENSKTYARIKSITMRNFRNIEYGKVEFPNANMDNLYKDDVSILGLYGQNGSGKTSLVMAIGMLKVALSGRRVDDVYHGCVKTGCKFAELEYEINMVNEEKIEFTIVYSFHLFHEKTKVERDGELVEINILRIGNEVFKMNAFRDGKKEYSRIKTIIDTNPGASSKGYAFGNDTSYISIFGKDKELARKVDNIRAVAYNESTSFIFNPSIFELWMEYIKDEYILHALQMTFMFGNFYLHIVDTAFTGLNNMNQFVPIMLWAIDEGMGPKMVKAVLPSGNGEAARIPAQEDKFFNDAITSLNEVLTEIVPGLQIDLQNMGDAFDEKGRPLKSYMVFSNRKGVRIPFNRESDGIRRIISILSLLIAVYNQHSMTVVVDELDAGIYEYLLGEMLKVISKSGKGQLVFTSHNLRPLEVLPAKYICFTTTNPELRYTKVQISGNSNLRDCYYRMIILGSDDEELYDSTDSSEIELAFYNAGRIQDKEL